MGLAARADDARPAPGRSDPANTRRARRAASTVANGGCIATATSSLSASGFLKTRSRRLRSWIDPTTSVSSSAARGGRPEAARCCSAASGRSRLRPSCAPRRDEVRELVVLAALEAEHLRRRSAAGRRARGSRTGSSSCRRRTSRGTSGRRRGTSSGSSTPGPRCFASSSAAHAVEPHEPPTSSPSSRASRRAVRNESRSETRIHSSTTSGSIVAGQVSLPMPSTRYGCDGCSASAV